MTIDQIKEAYESYINENNIREILSCYNNYHVGIRVNITCFGDLDIKHVLSTSFNTIRSFSACEINRCKEFDYRYCIIEDFCIYEDGGLFVQN